MGIKPCPWVTVRSLKILETIFVVMEKRSPADQVKVKRFTDDTKSFTAKVSDLNK